MKFPETFRYHPGNQYESRPGDTFGCFQIPGDKTPSRRALYVIAVDGEETNWEHVSVSLGRNSTTPPSWAEMCFIKDLFWNEDEWVLQYHPAKSDYVNMHQAVLHLWKPVKDQIPKPPKDCV